MDIKFKNLSEAERAINSLEQEINDIYNLLQNHKQLVTSAVRSMVTSEVFKLIVNDDNFVSKLDIEAKGIKIPGGIKALTKNYVLLQELLEKEESLSGAETSILLSFKGEERASPILAQIKRLKAKIAVQKDEILAFLNQVATKTIPPSFNKYVFAVAESVVKHVDLTEDQYDVYYYLSTIDSALLYSAFIELRDLKVGDQKVNTVYTSIHWCLGSDQIEQQIRVNLGYKWESPTILFEESKLVVSSVAECITMMDRLLEAEEFAVDIGVQQLSDRLKKGVKLNQISVDSLNLQNKIKKLQVEPDMIKVTLNRVAKNELSDVQAHVYLGIQKFFDQKTKLRMSISQSGLILTFVITNFAKGKQFTTQEIEYFKSWGLTQTQIKKIQTILG